MRVVRQFPALYLCPGTLKNFKTMRPNNFDLRRTGAIVLCLAAAMFAASCGGNASKKKAADGATETEQTETKAPKSGGITTSNIVGTWTNATGVLSYEFKADGTGAVKNTEDASKNESFKWKMSGKTISVDTESGGYNQFDYIGDDQLEDAMRQKFTKK